MFGNFRRSWSQGRHGMRGHGPFAVIAKSGVELSDEQVEKLAALKGDGLVDFSGKRSHIVPRMREIMDALSKPEIDKEKVRAIHKDIQAKRNEMADQFLERTLSAAEILTAEQRKQVRMYMLRASLGLDDDGETCPLPPPPPGPRGR